MTLTTSSNANDKPATDTASALRQSSTGFPFGFRAERDEIADYAEAALTEAKLEGQLLAVRARWISLFVVALMLPIVNPTVSVLFYHGFLVLFALIGYAQLRVARLGQSRAELALIFCDIVLIMMIAVVPNPLEPEGLPMAVKYQFGNFQFYYVLLAAATLAYSWRTVIAFGTWTSLTWVIGLVIAYFISAPQPELTERVAEVFSLYPALKDVLMEVHDPNSFRYDLRFQEIVIFFLVAATLAITVRRTSLLLRSHAASERERTNLSRYFSPNVVEQLSKNDEPLKDVRTQDVCVMFVDIVGFTGFAQNKPPQEVIGLLRDFHGAMGQAVFNHSGTLDKYLGDGLMATFGTPMAGQRDAINALECAGTMLEAVTQMNAVRTERGEPPIRTSIGLHFGPVVLGDIGSNRLEYAVIGDTVNVASRIEALTRPLGVHLAASDAFISDVRRIDADHPALASLALIKGQSVRGVDAPLDIWTALPVNQAEA